MKLTELKQQLARHPEKTVRFILPTGSKLPPHAHVTEVARIDKRFIDCGGTRRNDVLCRLQTWFADDTDHRLSVEKLAAILTKAAPLLETEDMEVEIEHEAPFISQFPVERLELDGEALMVRLGVKHTACLAEDRCVPPALNKRPSAFQPIPTLQPTKCC